jgi:hypothetical protein
VSSGQFGEGAEAAAPANSDQLVGTSQVAGGKHDSDTRQHHIELAVGARKRLGVRLLPFHLDAPMGGLLPTGVEELGAQCSSNRVGCAPYRRARGSMITASLHFLHT